MVEFIIKKQLFYDLFLIKSILLVIVNKKPHFKLVPLLIFQFPSPATLNNWLSHLLNLYSSITYLYSSSILSFVCVCVCVCVLIFFFLLFFFFLSQGHMKQKNGSRCPFRPVSSAETAGISRIGLFRWPFRPYRFPFPPESACFGLNRRESKKKKRGESTSRTPDAVSGCVGLRCDDLGAASVLSRC